MAFLYNKFSIVIFIQQNSIVFGNLEMNILMWADMYTAYINSYPCPGSGFT